MLEYNPLEHLNQTLAALDEDGLSEDASLVLIAEMDNSISKFTTRDNKLLSPEPYAMNLETILIRALNTTSALTRNMPSDICSFVASQATLMILDTLVSMSPSGPEERSTFVFSWCQGTFDAIFDDYTLTWKKRHTLLGSVRLVLTAWRKRLEKEQPGGASPTAGLWHGFQGLVECICANLVQLVEQGCDMVVGSADNVSREIWHLVLQFIKCGSSLLQHGSDVIYQSWKRTLVSLGVGIVEATNKIFVDPESNYLSCMLLVQVASRCLELHLSDIVKFDNGFAEALLDKFTEQAIELWESEHVPTLNTTPAAIIVSQDPEVFLRQSRRIAASALLRATSLSSQTGMSVLLMDTCVSCCLRLLKSWDSNVISATEILAEFQENDDELVQIAANLFNIWILSRAATAGGSSAVGVEFSSLCGQLINPHIIFSALCDSLGYDAGTLVDLLLEGQTDLLSYLLKYLKLVNADYAFFEESLRAAAALAAPAEDSGADDSDDGGSDTGFEENAVLYPVVDVLDALRERLQSAKTKELLPFGPDPLLRLLDLITLK